MGRRVRSFILFSTTLVAGMAALAQAPESTLVFTGTEKSLALVGPYASARLLLEERTGATTRDVSAEAVYTLADPKVATVSGGNTLAPKRRNDSSYRTPQKPHGDPARECQGPCGRKAAALYHRRDSCADTQWL